MKRRRDFLKLTGITAASVVASTAFGLDGVVGNVKDVLTQKPVENASLEIYSHPENDLIAKYLTDSNGNYNLTATGVKPYSWKNFKRLFSNEQSEDIQIKREARKIAKKALSDRFVRAEIVHPDHHPARRYFDSRGNNFDTTIIPSEVDMQYFDTWTRAKGKGLQKWLIVPRLKINTYRAEPKYVDLIKEIISDDIFNAMKWKGIFIEETESVNNVEQEGEYLIYWGMGTGDYSGNHNETLRGNEIISASAWFYEPNKLRRVFLKTLTQGLGLVRNPSGNEFYTSDGYYTQQGLDMLSVLCSMKPGNISPDTDPVPS